MLLELSDMAGSDKEGDIMGGGLNGTGSIAPTG